MERWLSYTCKCTCHVILLAKLHGMYMYLYTITTFPHQLLKLVSEVAFLHRFHCIPIYSVNLLEFCSLLAIMSLVCLHYLLQLTFQQYHAKRDINVNRYTFRRDNSVRIPSPFLLKRGVLQKKNNLLPR